MLLSDAIVLYMEYGRARQLSTNTLNGSHSVLHHFEKWLHANGYPSPSLDAFTPDVLRRYLYALQATRCRPRTVHGYFYPLKAMGKLLVERRHLSSNPVLAIVDELPRFDAPRQNVARDSEIVKLMDACSRQPDARDVALSRGVLSVLAYGGARRQELLDMHVSDYNPEDASITYRRGKGGKGRRIFPCEECLSALSEWLALRGEAKHDWLWAYDAHRRLGEEGLRTILATVKAIAGLKSAAHIKPHAFRHAAASRMMRNGASLAEVQHFLGHASIATTARYLHVTEEDLRNVSETTSLRPREAVRPARNGSRRRWNVERRGPMR